MNKMFIALFIGALLLFGCVGGLGNSFDGSGTTGVSSPPSKGLVTSESASPGSVVIKTGNVRVLVPTGTLEDRFSQLKGLVQSNGADMSGISYNEYTTEKAYSLTMKIDPAKFDSILTELKTLGEVKSVDTNLEDVTTQYTDLTVRISNLETELGALNSLYNRTENIEDILKIRTEINNVQTQLDIYKQQKLDLDRRSSKSTITVYLYEEKSAVETNLIIPLGDLAAVFFGAMGFAITAVVGILGFLIPGAIIVAIIWLIWKATRGKSKK